MHVQVKESYWRALTRARSKKSQSLIDFIHVQPGLDIVKRSRFSSFRVFLVTSSTDFALDQNGQSFSHITPT